MKNFFLCLGMFLGGLLLFQSLIQAAMKSLGIGTNRKYGGLAGDGV
jgi:hypothetical protein